MLINRKNINKYIVLLFLSSILSPFFLPCLFGVNAFTQELLSRKYIVKPEIRALPVYKKSGEPSLQTQYRLIVKFKDDLTARVQGKSLDISDANKRKKLSEVTERFGMTFSTLIKSPPEKLKKIKKNAIQVSKTNQPDLEGISVVQMEDESPASLEAAGKALQAMDEVEFAYIQTLNVPPPGDIWPTTPLHVDKQAYLGSAPGINALYAWSLGYKGAGVRLSDCEYGWVATHEDLNDINLNLEQGQTIYPDVITKGWDNHGTAVIGVTSGVVNSYGISGMVPDATVHTYPEWTLEEGYRRTTSILNAIADSSPGDVVMLEMQTSGFGGYVPAEFDPAVWLAVKSGTDAGVVIVAAAGNGNQNLDGANYANYIARGDSGAIIVGAGSNTVSHDKLSFSTYGSRVNLQGWGTSVFTLGYGYFEEYGGDANQRYTAVFNGTSSATPFIASACVIIQQAAQEILGRVLTPLELRDHLINTGVLQQNTGHIGPFPDLQAAIDSLPSLAARPEIINIQIQ